LRKIGDDFENWGKLLKSDLLGDPRCLMFGMSYPAFCTSFFISGHAGGGEEKGHGHDHEAKMKDSHVDDAELTGSRVACVWTWKELF
jgi:hypothetical protein